MTYQRPNHFDISMLFLIKNENTLSISIQPGSCYEIISPDFIKKKRFCKTLHSDLNDKVSENDSFSLFFPLNNWHSVHIFKNRWHNEYFDLREIHILHCICNLCLENFDWLSNKIYQ